MHDDIRIGTLVKAERNPASYIRQILPYGFESFELTFPTKMEGLNLDQIAADVRRTLEEHGGGAIISSIGIYGNALVDEQIANNFGRLIDAAEKFGCKLVCGFMPDKFPEYGQCVHKIAAHPDRPERLYMQNHGGFEDPSLGVLRSDDGGRTWTSIAKGLPSDFGFPISVHPHDPDVVYVAPLEPATRTCPAARPAIWRSENAGGKWQRLASGLPKKDAWFTVLRDGMDLDDGRRPSVWFGTTTGQLWRGRDGGESFECLTSSLPPIYCVKAAVV